MSGATMVKIAGRCPACQSSTLFAGEGGHVTCSLLGCGDPCAADRYLHGESIDQPAPHDVDALRCLLAERRRQDGKWGDQSPNHDLVWLAVLVEEVGECAKALLSNLFGGDEAGGLGVEAVQAAAVGMAWASALGRRGQHAESLTAIVNAASEEVSDE